MNNIGNAANNPERQIGIRRAEEKDLPRVTSMFTTRLVDSVEQSYVLEGIQAKEELMNLILTIQNEDEYRVGEIWIAGDYQGALTGHYGKGFSILSLLQRSIKTNKRLNKTMTKEDLNQLNENLKRMEGTTDFRWRKKICGNNRYYYLQLVAIESSLKGSGIFRQLIEPILMRSNHEKLPILLDTHDENNVPIYEHFGFELVEKHHAKSGAPIVQYSMIKRCE